MQDRVAALYTDEQKLPTIAEVAEELGIGRETVREHLVRANVPRRAAKARGSRDPQAVADAVRRYVTEGETLWEIAERYGKTATTIRSWLLDAGVTLRPPGGRVDESSVRETIRLYVDEDLTIDEVARRQGLHPWTVRQRLVDNRIPRRPRGRRRHAPVEPPPVTRPENERFDDAPDELAILEQDAGPVEKTVEDVGTGGLDAFAEMFDRGETISDVVGGRFDELRSSALDPA